MLCLLVDRSCRRLSLVYERRELLKCFSTLLSLQLINLVFSAVMATSILFLSSVVHSYVVHHSVMLLSAVVWCPSLCAYLLMAGPYPPRSVRCPQSWVNGAGLMPPLRPVPTQPNYHSTQCPQDNSIVQHSNTKEKILTRIRTWIFRLRV